VTGFWIAAGLLVFVAVLFVALPLVRRAPERDEATADKLNLSIRKDQLAELERDLEAGVLSPEQFEQGRLEVERRLLEEADRPAAPPRSTRGSRVMAVVVAVALPVVALSLYQRLGRIDALGPIPPATQEAAHEIGAEQLAAMVQRLADRLKDTPEDAEGWMMLGRSYAVLHRYEDAVRAYARARDLLGDNPDVLTSYADALAMASGGTFTPEAKRLIDRALEVDPGHQKALWLAGTIAFETGDYPKALDDWQRLATLLPPGSEMARTMAANIAEVKSLMGEAPAAGGMEVARADQAPEAAPVAAEARVDGVVELAPALAGRIPPGATLFVFARAPQGPRMPLAILRRPVGKLPMTFTLDRSMGMMPGMTLADFDPVLVGARISASGNAMPASGDLQGLTGPVAVGSTGVTVTIDEVVP
jgi:cytochrome c-type biogenesis protein CcmH